jgi:hypothetical protein
MKQALERIVGAMFLRDEPFLRHYGRFIAVCWAVDNFAVLCY